MQVHRPIDEITLQHTLLRIRMVEEAISERYKEQKMRCPVHLSIGQEAIAVGVCHQLAKSDYAVSNHRAHAHYLAKGGDLKKMIAEMYGKESGCSRGRGGSMHLVDLNAGFIGSTPIVAGSIPIGVGAAFASFLQNEEKVTAIFFGEAATEEGVFSESLNFAALHALRVLFICENNFYSVNTPLAVRQPTKRQIVAIAEAHGVFALKGNGCDLKEVCAHAAKALTHVRAGLGPALIEYETYRFREHCGPNLDPFQPPEEISHWQKRDPLRYVDESSRERIRQEIDGAFAFAEAAPFPRLCDEESFYA